MEDQTVGAGGRVGAKSGKSGISGLSGESTQTSGHGDGALPIPPVAPSFILTQAGEMQRVKNFYEKNGYLSAPRQSQEATLRRLQAM